VLSQNCQKGLLGSVMSVCLSITKTVAVDSTAIFVNNQFDAQFFFMYVYFYTLQVWGQPCAHHQENFINTTSGICHCL